MHCKKEAVLKLREADNVVLGVENGVCRLDINRQKINIDFFVRFLGTLLSYSCSSIELNI